MATSYSRFLVGFMAILLVGFGITYVVDIYATAQAENAAAQSATYDK